MTASGAYDDLRHIVDLQKTNATNRPTRGDKHDASADLRGFHQRLRTKQRVDC
jgi:hypothetical protein